MINFSEHCKTFFAYHEHLLVEKHLGKQSRELFQQLLVGIAYSIILCTGIFGNVCTCIVIARKRFMHTRTNFYLFSLAVSDLILLVCGLPIELFNAVYQEYPWRFGTATCRLRAFVTELSPLVSVMILTVFSVERYLCICHPFRRRVRWCTCFGLCCVSQSPTHAHCLIYRDPRLTVHAQQRTHHNERRHSIHQTVCRPTLRSKSLKSCTVLIVNIWIVAALSAIPVVGLTEAFSYVHLPNWQDYFREFNKTSSSGESYSDSNFDQTPLQDACISQVNTFWIEGQEAKESVICAPSKSSVWAQYLSIQLVFLLNTALFFVTPMLIITIMYSRIAVQIRRSNMINLVAQSSRNSPTSPKSSVQEHNTIRNRKGITRMLVAVIVAFFICWAPFHLQRVVTATDIHLSHFAAEFIFDLSGFFYYISPTVNPILYSLMSVRFRRAFMAVFCTKKPNQQPRPPPILTHHSLHVPYNQAGEPNHPSSSRSGEHHRSL